MKEYKIVKVEYEGENGIVTGFFIETKNGLRPIFLSEDIFEIYKIIQKEEIGKIKLEKDL